MASPSNMNNDSTLVLTTLNIVNVNDFDVEDNFDDPNTTYQVLKICNDEQVTASFIQHNSLDKDSVAYNEANEGDVECLIDTVTPSKSVQFALDSAEDDVSVQNSSTKIIKKIKQEKLE